MYTDYKIATIINNGITTKTEMYIYEGDYKNVVNQWGETVNAYVRSKKLDSKKFEFKGNVIRSEMCKYFNSVLAEDKTRTITSAQTNKSGVTFTGEVKTI